MWSLVVDFVGKYTNIKCLKRFPKENYVSTSIEKPFSDIHKTIWYNIHENVHNTYI